MPILYIMCGVGFSGKSTLAKKIAEHAGATLVSQDGTYFAKRDELHLDLDNEEDWKKVQRMCREEIIEYLKKGESVVFDDVNTKKEHRDRARALAVSAGPDSMVIFLDTPIEVQKERQRKNLETGERHDVKQEYLDNAIRELESPTEDENVRVFKPDTDLETFLKSL